MDSLKLTAFAFAQAVWLAVRGLGRAVLGTARFDALVGRTGLRDFKSRTWLTRRVLPDGNAVVFRPQDECIVDEVYGDGVYSGAVIKPGQTVVDAGAHIGAFALMAARRVGPTGRVLAFEPSPRTQELLKRNLDANALSWVRFHPVALAEAEGTAEFFVADDAANNPAADTLSASSDRKGVTVRLRRLDDVITEERVTVIDHLKIDVEGAELRVLDGGPKALAMTKRIVMEVHPPRVSLDEVRSRLASLGFEVRVVHEAGGSVIIEAVRR